MGKDPAFLFYPGDYLRDTQCMEPETQVAYDRIICEHMRNICIRQQQVNFFTKHLNDEQRDLIFMVLERKEEGYVIPWVNESIEKRRAYSDSRRKNRRKKKDNICEDMKNICEHMENENENENKDINGKEFNLFWDKFHLITSKPKTDKESAIKNWKKLNRSEKNKAFENIEEFYDSIDDKKYCKKAWTYLRDKSFDDEFKPRIKQITMDLTPEKGMVF